MFEQDQDLCPDGVCQKTIDDFPCEGKLIRIYVRYGPEEGPGEFKTFEELFCIKCEEHNKLKLIDKHYINNKRKRKRKKGKGQKIKDKNRKKYDSKQRTFRKKTVDDFQEEQHDNYGAYARPLE